MSIYGQAKGTELESIMKSMMQAEANGTMMYYALARLAKEQGYDDLVPFDPERPDLPQDVREQVAITVKYEGYIQRQQRQVAEFEKLERRLLPPDMDYSHIQGLRLEAREKLDALRPLNVGQAGRISGVSPADVAALMIWLQAHDKEDRDNG